MNNESIDFFFRIFFLYSLFNRKKRGNEAFNYTTHTGKNFFYSLRLHSCRRANLNLAPITFFLLIKLCKSSTKKIGLWGYGKNENEPKKRILPPANYLYENYTIRRNNRIFIKLTILCVSGVPINNKQDKTRKIKNFKIS